MILIKKIKWLSQEGKEAEVFISDGEIQLVCFAHPFEKTVGEEITNPIQAFNTDNILSSDSKRNLLQKSREGFGYTITGRVKDRSLGLIVLGCILIEIDIPMPGDIGNDDFVSFTCERLDLV